MKTNTSPEAELAVRFTQIRDYFCNKNNKEFAKAVGDYPSNTSAYCNGTKNANLKILHKVAKAFPQVNKAWLVFGEGDMLATEINNETSAHNAIVNNGINNGEQKQEVNESGLAEISRLISIIETKDKQMYSIIESKDKQVASLIHMLGNKVNDALSVE